MSQLLKAASRSVCLAVLLALSAGATAAESLPFEYKLKAVFLLNFAKFVNWPPAAFADASAPLYICVIGEDPFGPVLEQVLHGETVQTHALKVLRPTAEREYQSCHIAFFSPSMAAHVSPLLTKSVGPYTLTVGDQDKFLQQGGMINFTVEDTKVRFVINTTPLSRASFEISSKLLSLGRAEQY